MMQRITQEVKIAITSLVLVKHLSTHGPREWVWIQMNL